MNKQKFIEFLRKPDSLNDQEVQDLEGIIDENPYFQSARTLLAKASRVKKHPNTKSYINSAATYSTDRVHLKKYLSGKLIFLSPIAGHESHEADHEIDRSEEIKTARTTSIQSKIKTNPVIHKPSQPVVTNMEVASDEKETEKVYDAPEQYKPKEETTDLDNLINELYRDMDELKHNREKLKQYEEQLEEEEAVDKALKKATSGKQSESSEKSTTKKTEEAPKKAAESKSARKTATKSPKSTTKKTTTKKATAKKTTAKKTTTKSSSTKKSGTKKSSSKGSSKSKDADKKEDKGEPQRDDQQKIISNFIKNNPSISKPDGTKKTNEDLSNTSTEFHPEVASEYLAEIYIQQGKKDRAQQIYEALIVKNPEKKAYFADIIEKLKE